MSQIQATVILDIASGEVELASLSRPNNEDSQDNSQFTQLIGDLGSDVSSLSDNAQVHFPQPLNIPSPLTPN